MQFQAPTKVCSVLLLTLVIAAGPVFAAQDTKPNVVVIITDDQRWDALGAAGHPWLKTPHLDRLAGEGARFANAFV